MKWIHKPLLFPRGHHQNRETPFTPRQMGSTEFERYHNGWSCPGPLAVELISYTEDKAPLQIITSVAPNSHHMAREANGPRWTGQEADQRCGFLPFEVSLILNSKRVCVRVCVCVCVCVCAFVLPFFLKTTLSLTFSRVFQGLFVIQPIPDLIKKSKK